MTIREYRKALRSSCSTGYNIMFFINASMAIFIPLFVPAASFFDKPSMKFTTMILLACMMYMFSVMTMLERHPVFQGTGKTRKGVEFYDKKLRNFIYQLPADRATVVRSYIKTDRFFCIFACTGMILYGAVMVIRQPAVITAACGLLFYLILSVEICIVQKYLIACAPDKIASANKKLYFLSLFYVFIAFTHSFDSIIKIGESLMIPALTSVIGIICIILGALYVYIFAGNYRKMLDSCNDRSIYGRTHITGGKFICINLTHSVKSPYHLEYLILFFCRFCPLFCPFRF